ncbi:hypothetical protein [Acidovorax sp.]|uniref:hypothetical protein n=1 Tax=Acidovorax sp. TaxID=1872122 RepID=UPI00391F84BF
MLLRLRKIRRRLEEAYQDIRINYTYANAGVQLRRATDNERRLTIGVRDFIEAGCSIEFDAQHESWITRIFPDGVFEVKYSYCYEDPSSLARFLMTTRVEIAKDSSLALELFQEGVASWEAGVATVGARFVFKGNLQNWSDSAYCALTLAEPNETVVGCVMAFQKERLVYSITLRGLFFENVEEVECIVYPYLEQALALAREEAS